MLSRALCFLPCVLGAYRVLLGLGAYLDVRLPEDSGAGVLVRWRENGCVRRAAVVEIVLCLGWIAAAGCYAFRVVDGLMVRWWV